MHEIDLSTLQPWYIKQGFRESPFQVHSLEPNDAGLRLLVGRDTELRELCGQLLTPDKVVCVEGAFGSGKTSLVNAAAYYLQRAYEAGKSQSLIIPCRRTFQLTAETSQEDFVQEVYINVLQSLVDASNRIGAVRLGSDKAAAINKWLNDPTLRSGGINTPLGGASLSSTLNNSAGFTNSGLERLAQEWLREIFPMKTSGAIVCTIDNLEGLQSSVAARRLLNSLRDRLFLVHGLRWVICGANGIVSSATSSRVADYFSAPLKVDTLIESKLPLVLDARVQEYTLGQSSPLAITAESLEFLYGTLNNNLRGTLARAEEYCKEVFEQSPKLASDEIKIDRFNRWLRNRAQALHNDVEKSVLNTSWAILDIAMSNQFRGAFGIGNYLEIRKLMRTTISEETFRRHVNSLEKQDLAVKQFAADDNGVDDTAPSRGAFYTVTHKGALCYFHRLVSGKRDTIADASWLRTSASLRG
jgi:hypothetical protein